MKRAFKALLIAAPLLILTTAFAAPVPTGQSTPTTTQQITALATPVAAPAPTLIPSPPNLNAKGYVLMDANSGYIIAQKNANKKAPPASLTKLTTLYIIANELKSGQINLTDNVRISKHAWKMGGSRMFVKVGSQVPAAKLIQGIIVASGNDATAAMAEYIGGTEPAFVNLMNQTAQSLGMINTHYMDSNGLPKDNHYSTPMDIAKLVRAFITNFPEYYPWFKQKWITYNHIKQPNRNRLLWRDPSVDGLKTGHTEAAGFCLVSSALRDGVRLISVVMGTPTDSARASDSEALLNYGFRFYESHKMYAGNTPLAQPRAWFGQDKYVKAGIAKDMYITIPHGQYKNIQASISTTGVIQAPVTKGQQLGTVNVILNGTNIASQPLIALQADPKGGLWTRFTDHISHFFHGWFGGKKK